MNRVVVAIAALVCVLTPLAAFADGVSPRVVSLPRGPGSVEGLGGNFEANASTGGASYQVSFRMPPAVGNIVQQLGIA